MKAYIVVGPTNDHPAFLSCFDNFVDVSVIAGTSVAGTSENVACGQKNSAIDPCCSIISIARPALLIVERILP